MESGKAGKGCEPSWALTRVNVCNSLSISLNRRDKHCYSQLVYRTSADLLRACILFLPLQTDFLAQELVPWMAEDDRAGAAESVFLLRQHNTRHNQYNITSESEQPDLCRGLPPG